MNSAEKEAVLHCLKAMIDEAVCEECVLYGTTGTDHCEEDCVRLAINALKQEPCTDAVCREGVAKVLLKYAHSTVGKAFAEFLVSQINDLPSVKPQYTDAEIQKMQDLEFAEIQKAYEIGKDEGSSEWIPVSEPPKASGRYIVTRHFFNDDFVEMASYSVDLHKVDKYDFPKRKAGWYNYDSEYGHYEVDDIVAWMPIEPYKASSTGAERSDKE